MTGSGMNINDLLAAAVQKGASDLHLKVGSFPMARIYGHLEPVSTEKQLDHEDLVEMAASVMSTARRIRSTSGGLFTARSRRSTGASRS